MAFITKTKIVDFAQTYLIKKALRFIESMSIDLLMDLRGVLLIFCTF